MKRKEVARIQVDNMTIIIYEDAPKKIVDMLRHAIARR